MSMMRKSVLLVLRRQAVFGNGNGSKSLSHMSSYSSSLCFYSSSAAKGEDRERELCRVNEQVARDNLWMKSPEGQAAVRRFQLEDKHEEAYTQIDKEATIDTNIESESDPQEHNDLKSFIAARLATISPPIAPSPSLMRMLSTLLCFPLTLGYAVSCVFPHAHVALPRLRVLIVGARAESSLPSQWWKQMLIGFAEKLPQELSIRFVGPGLQPNASLSAGKTKVSRGLATVEFMHSMTSKESVNDAIPLHEHPDANELLRWADVFVLFNPGYGSSILKERWNPTMHLLLETKKPVICTSHGDDDLHDDLKELIDGIAVEGDNQMLGNNLEFLINPTKNPYASLSPRVYNKPSTVTDEKDIVITNKLIYAFQSK